MAYGSHCTLCFASADGSSNGDLVVRRTVIGHKAPISAVAWIPPFNGPGWSTFSGHLLSGSADGIIKLWFVDSTSARELASLQLSSAADPAASSSVEALHGCYLDERESRIFVVAASRSEVFGWSLHLTAGLEGGIMSSACASSTGFTPLNRDPALCLSLRVVRLGGPSITDSLVLLLVGLSTGQLEVWALAERQDAFEPTLAGSLKGHTDWLRCLDCIQIHQQISAPTTEGDESKTKANAAQFLVASGSQDCHIRVWHMQLTDKHDLSSTEAKAKGMELTLPPAYESCSLFARLECVLSGHDHWVTGLSWAPAPLTFDARPLLLSASMDKSLIVWEPSRPPLLTSAGIVVDNSPTPDIWLEKQRYGTVGGDQLGFLDCAWGDSGRSVYGHGYQGNISSWYFSVTGGGNVQCSLTGHAGPITDLTWSPTVLGKDSKIKLSGDGYDCERPLYLLTASKDQSIRLHALFRTGGFGCSPPVSTWRELARPQVHGYDMNAIACLDALHYVSAGDEKVARVFSATAAFVQRFLSEQEIARHPSLLGSLPSGAAQPALGLSNRATETFTADDEDDELATANTIESDECGPSDIGDPLYPPSEDSLAQLTLWAETRKLYGHSYEVFCLAAHPRGILVASACKSSKMESANIFLWRASDWVIHQKLSYHQLTVTQLSFNPRSDDLLSVSRDRKWCLWKNTSKSSGDELPEYSLAYHSPPGNAGHSRIIWTCAWNRDGRFFVTGSRDKRIMVWDPSTGSRVESPHTMPNAVTALDIGPAFSATSAGDLSEHAPILLAVGLECGSIHLLALSLSGDAKRTCSFTALFQMPSDWAHGGGAVKRLAFYHPSYIRTRGEMRTRLASGGEDGLVRIFIIQFST
ncbi:hypothetical protein AAHC03_0558 [Spirometra sp. Aus1]